MPLHPASEGTREQLWFSTREAGEFLDRSESTIRRMVHAGELKVHWRGNRMRVPLSELQRLASAPVDGFEAVV